jgi:hypothetical protein
LIFIHAFLAGEGVGCNTADVLVLYHAALVGEQAEIVFSFEGQPPFAFTYTRSEESHLGRPGKILETHVRPLPLSLSSHPAFEACQLSAFLPLQRTWPLTIVDCFSPSTLSSHPDCHSHHGEDLLDLRRHRGNMEGLVRGGSLLSSTNFPKLPSFKS